MSDVWLDDCTRMGELTSEAVQPRPCASLTKGCLMRQGHVRRAVSGIGKRATRVNMLSRSTWVCVLRGGQLHVPVHTQILGISYID